MGDENNIDLGWLVEKRSQIQQLMFEFYELQAKFGPKSDDRIWQVYNLSVGALFSLWRAVFLIRTDHEPTKEMKNAVEFLRELIETNSIGFSQDRKSAHWSAGYYVNNAALRLYMMAELEGTGAVLRDRNKTYLKKNMHPEVVNFAKDFDLRIAWEECYRGLTFVLSDLLNSAEELEGTA